MGYALAMSAEIRAWLDELRGTDPAAAAAVGHALTALAERGPALGPPLVQPLPAVKPAGSDPREALDRAYQDRLERLQRLRRGAQEASDVRLEIEVRIAELESSQAGNAVGPQEGPASEELSELTALMPGLVKAERRLTEASQRMQADTDMFRVRKETLKAGYTAADAQRDLAELLEPGDGANGEPMSAAAAAARLAELQIQIDRELARENGQSELLELRPGQPGDPADDVSLIFAIEPPGTALIISVVYGDDALRYEWRQAADVAAEVLQQVQVGQDPGASAIRFADAAAFAAEFAPARPTTVTPSAGGGAEISVLWLPFPLAAEGHPSCQYEVLAGSLELTGAAGTDMFVDPAGAGQPPDAGRLVGAPPDGDFTLSARVSVGFGATFDAGVLLVHAGEQRWAKLCFELSPQRRPTAVTVVTRDTSDDCNSFEVTGDTLWLRICRAGRAWAFHASTDGSWWRLLRYFDLDAAGPVRVGFVAQSPTGPGCTARFADIRFSPGAPADLRDGS